MRNFLLGVVFAIVVGVVLLRVGTSLVAQQNRLQQHGVITSTAPGGSGYGDVDVHAVCDTATGAMIYVGSARNGAGTWGLPNSCAKAK